MKKTIFYFLTIIIFTFLIVSCTFMDEFLFPTTISSTPPRASLTFVGNEPTYIGQDFEVKITLNPRKKVNYIRVVMVDLVNNKEIVMQEDYCYEAVFKLKVTSSKFRLYVETPYQNKSKNNEVYYPSRDFWYEFADYTPPTVNYTYERINSSSNQYRLFLDTIDEQSGLKQVYVNVDGTRQNVDINRDQNSLEVIITLTIGNHAVSVYAQNNSGLTGFTEQIIEVTPPKVNTPPEYETNMPGNFDVFKGEIVYLNANIFDNISYLSYIEIISSMGWSKKITFDPLQKDYYLNYPVKIEENQNITIKIANGNDITNEIIVNINVKVHQVPTTTLNASPSVDELEKGTEVEINFTSTAHDGEKIDKVYLLVNGITYRSYEVSETETYSNSAKFNLLNGVNIFSILAVDTKGARGMSESIEIKGTKIDRDPPTIMMLLPEVAYQNIETELPFLAEDYESELKGNPTLKCLETNTNFVVNSFGGTYFKATWVPENIQNYTFMASAIDEEGNEATAVKTVNVKDPTGILWPTVGELAISPNPLTIGDVVELNLSVVPPPDMEQTAITVSMGVTNAVGNPVTNLDVTSSGNIYTTNFKPDAKGNYSAQANISWGDGTKLKTGTFEVLSPEPTLTFTVEPSKTYRGGDVVLSLMTDTANPYASVTVIEMKIGDGGIAPTIVQIGDFEIYTATKNTMNMDEGVYTASAIIRDNFKNEKSMLSYFTVITPGLKIKSIDPIPNIGQIFRVYNPVSFEVYLDNTFPEQIVPSGEIEIVHESGSTSKSIKLYPSVDDPYLYVNAPDDQWVPSQEGLYTISADVDMKLGTSIFSTRTSIDLYVEEQEISISIASSPTYITVGKDVDLIFNIIGMMGQDEIQQLRYSVIDVSDQSVLFKNSLEGQSDETKYTDSISYFEEEGTYTVYATVNTLASEIGASSTLYVEKSIVSPENIILVDPPDSNNLYSGVPMTFKLGLINPDSLSNIQVYMYLAKKNGDEYEEIPNTKTRASAVDAPLYQEFENDTPMFFTTRESTEFYVVAEIDLISESGSGKPSITLDDFVSKKYTMPGPDLNIEYNRSKDYFGGYEGALELIVRKPNNMTIQTPLLTARTNVEFIDTTPFEGPVVELNGAVVKYKYKIKPEELPDSNSTGTFEFITSIYNEGNISKDNLIVSTPTKIEYEKYTPKINVTVVNSEVGTVNKSKDPVLLFEIDKIPEFFFEENSNAELQYEVRLNGNAPQEGYRFSLKEKETEVTFLSEMYQAESENSDIYAEAKISSLNYEPEFSTETIGFSSSAGHSNFKFIVQNPEFGKPNFTTADNYYTNTDSVITVSFPNTKGAEKNIEVKLEVGTGNNVKTYTKSSAEGDLIIDNSYIKAVFDKVVFTEENDNIATATIYGVYNNKEELQTGSTIIDVKGSEPSVNVIFPTNGGIIKAGQPFSPSVSVINTPSVREVRISIYEGEGKSATVVIPWQKAIKVSSENGESVYELPENKTINKSGKCTVYASILTDDADKTWPASAVFTVESGEITNVNLAQEDDVAIVFVYEDTRKLEYKYNLVFNYDNPFKVADYDAVKLIDSDGNINKITIDPDDVATSVNEIDQIVTYNISLPIKITTPGTYTLSATALTDYASKTSDVASITINAYQIIPEPDVTFTRNSIMNPGDEVEFEIVFNVSKDFYDSKKNNFNSLFTYSVQTPRLENVSFNISTEESSGGVKDIIKYKIMETRKVPDNFEGTENDIQCSFEIRYPSSIKPYTNSDDPDDDYLYSITDQ